MLFDALGYRVWGIIFHCIYIIFLQPIIFGALHLFIIAIVIRLAWSLTIGLVFFASGLLLFILLDIFAPHSNSGYKVLNIMYKIGSLGVFKGLRLEQDNFDINVEKKRQP